MLTTEIKENINFFKKNRIQKDYPAKYNFFLQICHMVYFKGSTRKSRF
jgi:hypothetical protein